MKDNGVFTVSAGGVTLRDCVPGMDSRAIMPLRVSIRRHTLAVGITYELLEGHIETTLAWTDDQLTIDTALFGTAAAPNWLYAIHSAQVDGATRCSRQGVGFSGPTNIVELTGRTSPCSFESYMITALESAHGAMAIYTCDHRSYLAKTQIHSRVHRAEFRNRRITGTDLFLESGFSTEEVPVPSEGLRLPRVTISEAAALADATSGASRAIASANQARVPDRSKYCFCSWYTKKTLFDRDDLARVLSSAADAELPLDCVQIDDGYQPFWGDWLKTNSRWPGGMAEAAEAIRDAGYKPGIWIAPLTAEDGSAVMRDHPDWLLRDLNGEPIVKMQPGDSPGSRTRYALDLSHPGVIAHVREAFTTLRAWGYTYFKTDFMDWGYVDSTTVRRHTPGRTSAQWFDLALRTIREAIGDESYWLACISYFPPFVGYCDAMRVASDVSPHWPARLDDDDDGPPSGVANMLNESFHCQYLNNVLWQNDPDVVYLRKDGIRLSDAEVRSLALWAGMLGGVVCTSDFFDALPPSRMALWRFLTPGRASAAKLPYWGRADMPLFVAVRESGTGTVAFVMNPTDAPQEATLTIRELVGSDTAITRERGPEGARPAAVRDALRVHLAPHESALFWLGDGEPPSTLAGP